MKHRYWKKLDRSRTGRCQAVTSVIQRNQRARLLHLQQVKQWEGAINAQCTVNGRRAMCNIVPTFHARHHPSTLYSWTSFLRSLKTSNAKIAHFALFCRFTSQTSSLSHRGRTPTRPRSWTINAVAERLTPRTNQPLHFVALWYPEAQYNLLSCLLSLSVLHTNPNLVLTGFMGYSTLVTQIYKSPARNKLFSSDSVLWWGFGPQTAQLNPS